MKLTVPVAARLVGRNPETVRRWIREGKLRSEKVGTQHLVDREEILGFLEDGELTLPPHWQQTAGGEMPPWERLVRDGRESH
jgi:excisionase family DNA binding protein